MFPVSIGTAGPRPPVDPAKDTTSNAGSMSAMQAFIKEIPVPELP